VLTAFLRAIEPFREDLVVGVECVFCWYCLADFCAAESIELVLGHAYYSKKSKPDGAKMGSVHLKWAFSWPAPPPSPATN